MTVQKGDAMSKIRDWFIHLFGGKTEEEYKLMQKSRDYYYKSYELICDSYDYGYNYEYRAKCAAINQARKWKKKYDDLVKENKQNYEEEHKHQIKYNKLNDLYGQMTQRAMSFQARCITLSKNIVMIDGVPLDYIKKQMCERFAAEISDYISYVTNEIYDPMTQKTQTNVTGMLEVVKPNE